MGSRFLLIGLLIPHAIGGMLPPTTEKSTLSASKIKKSRLIHYTPNQNSNNSEITAPPKQYNMVEFLGEKIIKHIILYFLDSKPLLKKEIFTCVRPLLAANSAMLMITLSAAIEYYNKTFPGTEPLTFNKAVVKLHLFSCIKDGHYAIVDEIVKAQQYNVLGNLILYHSKKLEPIIKQEPFHSLAPLLIRETMQVVKDKLMVKKVGAFALQAKIDINGITKGPTLMDQAVKNLSGSLAELFFTVGAEHQAHLVMHVPYVHYAISQNEGIKLFNVLMKHNYSVNHQDPATMSTPLMVACSFPQNGLEPVEAVLAHKPDVNLVNIRDHSALSCACLSGFWAAAKLLLKHPELNLGLPANPLCPNPKTIYARTLDALQQRIGTYPNHEKAAKKIEKARTITKHQEQLKKLKSLIKSCNELNTQSP